MRPDSSSLHKKSASILPLTVCSLWFFKVSPRLPKKEWLKRSFILKPFGIAKNGSFLIRPDYLMSYTLNYHLECIVIEHITMHEFCPGRWEWANIHGALYGNNVLPILSDRTINSLLKEHKGSIMIWLSWLGFLGFLVNWEPKKVMSKAKRLREPTTSS